MPGKIDLQKSLICINISLISVREEDSNHENQNSAQEQKSPPRPPNRKKHDEQVSEFNAKIKDLEDKRHKANERLRTNREWVSGFREKRDRISSEKADLDDKLNVINKAVETKKDAIQKLKANFVVTSEEALDQQVISNFRLVVVA